MARRAALLGVSPRRYTKATSGVGLQTLLWYPIYPLSATLVSTYAITHGLTASPPELLPIPVTILLLCGWLLFWVRFVEPAQAYEDMEVRSQLTDRGGCLFELVLLLVGLLLPVLTYVLVLIVVP